MPDRTLFPLLGLFALAMIALALVWPQGQGTRSPWPFGRTPQPAPAASKPAGPPPVLGMAPAAATPPQEQAR